MFYELANFLEMEEDVFRALAYEKAAFSLEILENDIEEIYQKEGEAAINEVPGVGKGIAEKIIEYLKTGKIKYYQRYRKKYPIDVGELTSVEGLGPKRIFELYKRLKIKNLKDLEKTVKNHKIRKLANFGEKSEKNILEGIKFLKRNKGRFLLGEILPQVRLIEKRLKNLKEVKKVDVCGSVRRRKETIGDVDFLALSENPGKIMDSFCSLPGLVKIWAKGKTKSSIRLEQGFDVDLRIVPRKSYGAALQYFTGNKEHNIKLRKIAIDKGFKLNEYGLFKGKKILASGKEEKIYRALAMECPEPEIREDRGEIEILLAKGKLPELIELKDIRGDLHCHSNWNGGENSIEEMVQEAVKQGYQYFGISDHTKFLRIENGLDKKQLLKQDKEIKKLNSKSKFKIKILHGCETNILNDGSLDIKDEVLRKLDYVIAGIHSNLKMPKEKMTERIIRAMKNPYLRIIAHPTGRLLKKRDGYQIDFDKILRVAKETKTILEINASPQRLDLNDINIKRTIEAGVKLIINTDSHHKDQLAFMEYGVFQARRGWAEKKDVVNSWPLKKLLEFFEK